MSTQEESSSLIGSLSNVVGTSEPALTLLLSVLLGYPLALFHRHYLFGKSANLQHIYFILTGFALGFFNYGLDTFHSIFTVLVTYLTMILFKGSNIMVGFTFVFNMVYLLIGYFYFSTNDYDINWTLPQCVLVLRLIGIAFDYYDGSQEASSLSKDQKAAALSNRPTALEFFAHMFFPASFLVGPQFPMRRYQKFVAGEFVDSGVINEAPKSCIPYAIKRGLLGVMYLAIFQIVGIYINDDYMISQEFYEVPFWRRMLMLGFWGRISLYKYISCWLLTEGVCILFGLTHNGVDKDNQVKWDGLANILIGRLETATEFNHYIQSFNTNTNHWVAQYIYKRLKFLGNRYISQGAALLFLAIWHGFHSGYFVCFIFEFLVMYMEKDWQSILAKRPQLREKLSSGPLVTPIYIILRLYTFVFMGWCMLPFCLLTYSRYMAAYANVNYIGVIVFLLYPVLWAPLIRAALGKTPNTNTDLRESQSGTNQSTTVSGRNKTD